jgi:signal transduction histidine kinase
LTVVRHPLYRGVAGLLLYALLYALLSALALAAGVAPSSFWARALVVLQPFGVLGGMAILVAARQELPPASAARDALLLLIGSFGVGAGAMMISFDMSLAMDNSLSLIPLLLNFASYALLGLALALLLPLPQGGEIGAALRLLTDIATLCIVLLLLLLSLGPSLSGSLPADARPVMLLWALDAGLLFAIIGVSLRYGRDGGPLLRYARSSVACLLLASTLWLILAWHPTTTAAWGLVILPLDTVHRVLLCLGVVQSLRRPPVPPRTAIPSRTEWRVSSAAPHVLILGVAGLGMADLIVLPPLVIGMFIGLSGLRFWLVAREERITTERLAQTRRDLAAALEREQRQRAVVEQARQQADLERRETDAFAARIVHDLATPLATLQQLAQSTPEILAAHATRFQRTTGLLTTFLEYATTYLHARRHDLRCDVVDLAVVCQDACAALQPVAAARGLTLTWEDETISSQIPTDELALRRIVNNLLVNALDHTSRGEITVTLADAPDHNALYLSVQDTGPGIPCHLHERLFLPSDRGDLACAGARRLRLGMGLGLGLAIVKELSEAMGGRVLLASAPDVGTTFTVVLPLRPIADTQQEVWHDRDNHSGDR